MKIKKTKTDDSTKWIRYDPFGKANNEDKLEVRKKIIIIPTDPIELGELCFILGVKIHLFIKEACKYKFYLTKRDKLAVDDIKKILSEFDCEISLAEKSRKDE